MKKLLLASAVASTMFAGVAQADGFAGPFVGAQLSYATATTSHDDNDQWYFDNENFETSDSTVIAGLRGGYNWTSGSLMYGAVAEYNVTNLDTTQEVSPSSPSYYAGASVNALASLRGRVGITSGDLAVFLSAGLAYADIENRMGDTDGSFETIRGNADSTGTVFGFGAEYMINPQSTVGVEYSAYQFDQDTHGVMNAGVPQVPYTFSFETHVNTITASYNYQF